MPPKVKYQKHEIINTALEITQKKGIDALTAREVAAALGVSTRPIFTYYASMDELKADVFAAAKERYREYIERGLKEPIPNLGVGQHFIRFAKEEPELYKYLFLSPPKNEGGSVMEELRMTQDLVRDSIMHTYRMDADAADKYFRDLWLVAYSFTTLIVTGECPYTDDQISAIFTEFSLSICKAYKEVPGLTAGDYNKDAIFKELVEK